MTVAVAQNTQVFRALIAAQLASTEVRELLAAETAADDVMILQADADGQFATREFSDTEVASELEVTQRLCYLAQTDAAGAVSITCVNAPVCIDSESNCWMNETQMQNAMSTAEYIRLQTVASCEDTLRDALLASGVPADAYIVQTEVVDGAEEIVMTTMAAGDVVIVTDADIQCYAVEVADDSTVTFETVDIQTYRDANGIMWVDAAAAQAADFA